MRSCASRRREWSGCSISAAGGTSATLVDIAGDFEPVSPTMRYADFSGDEIDHELLLRVFEELGHGSGIDPASTAAVGQLA